MILHLIAPALPPALDGIGDYTAALSADLAQSNRVKIFYPFGAEADPVVGVTAVPAFSVRRRRSVLRIVDAITSDRPDWLILQFNQFSYGKWGLNPFLPIALRRIRKKAPDTKVAVMFHEDFVPRINWKFVIMRIWQEWQFNQLGKLADVVLFSIDPWANRYRSRFPGKPVCHLPVGSNVPRARITREDARSRLNIPAGKIVLGLFGAVHATRNIPWLTAALDLVRKSNADVMILYIGTDAAAMRKLAGDIPLIAEGPLPAEEVSRRLSAVDVYLTPFIDGVSTRRGSFMAGLQHGLPTVATRGPHTDDIFLAEHNRAIVLADEKSPQEFGSAVVSLISDPTRRERLSQAAAALYEREFAWPAIAEKLLNILGREDAAAIKPDRMDTLREARLTPEGTAAK